MITLFGIIVIGLIAYDKIQFDIEEAEMREIIKEKSGTITEEECTLFIQEFAANAYFDGIYNPFYLTVIIVLMVFV